MIPPIGLYTPKYDYVSPRRPEIKMTGRSREKVALVGNCLDLSPEKPYPHISNVYIDRMTERKTKLPQLGHSVDYNTELPKVLSSNKRSASYVDMKKKLGR